MAVIIEHVGIAVEDLDAILKQWKDAFGVAEAGREGVPEAGLKVAFVQLGDSEIEFLQSTKEDNAIGKFIASRGPGIHHLALRVENVEETLEKAASNGIKLIDKVPRTGAGGNKIAFLHPKSTFGVLIELCEPEAEHR